MGFVETVGEKRHSRSVRPATPTELKKRRPSRRNSEDAPKVCSNSNLLVTFSYNTRSRYKPCRQRATSSSYRRCARTSKPTASAFTSCWRKPRPARATSIRKNSMTASWSQRPRCKSAHTTVYTRAILRFHIGTSPRHPSISNSPKH